MASSFVEDCKDLNAPRGSMKRTWSNESLGGAGIKSCVCAPATHARSFKCRLHRVNSHGHSSQSAPLPPQPAVNTSSTRTVEAQ